MPPRRRGRPPKPEGPKVALNLRVPADVKAAATEVAKARDETLSAAVERLLRRYIARHRPPPRQ